MTFAGLLAVVVACLEAAAVPYMITGSLASSFHGQPRATQDVDIVIDPTADQLAALVRGLQDERFYVDGDVAAEALARRSQFNAIGPEASKIDFLVRRDRPFSRVEFDRRESADLLGTRSFVATSEDLVIAKLEWAAASGSERQLRDIEGIVEIDDQLDTAYIDRWAEALGVADAWRSIRDDHA